MKLFQVLVLFVLAGFISSCSKDVEQIAFNDNQEMFAEKANDCCKEYDAANGELDGMYPSHVATNLECGEDGSEVMADMKSFFERCHEALLPRPSELPEKLTPILTSQLIRISGRPDVDILGNCPQFASALSGFANGFLDVLGESSLSDLDCSELFWDYDDELGPELVYVPGFCVPVSNTSQVDGGASAADFTSQVYSFLFNDFNFGVAHTAETEGNIEFYPEGLYLSGINIYCQ